ncbi:hypothetical protein GA0116948_10941 [Chitinophaga costaii]|uniref:DUF2147 domain-containing protein n=1 Tax=Chitinophaga costaii TaxID=1335309 RepID=A0A1C4EMD6_9BACT|nr:DUF2147 domain-containing protein [Chitinophaga costaii]SCC44805.1 hypothetical protein GA0116948_10941 [Chitinophaga costaii]
MKSLLLLLSLFSGIAAFAQDDPKADRILHIWEMDTKESKISFLKSGNVYHAQMIYGTRQLEADGKTYKKDIHNPDPALRSRTLSNYTLISGLTYEDGKWTNGKIYNYEDGNSYNVTITIEGKTLFMRVYKGVPVLGKTIKWTLSE